jgi:hypothetical protein
MNITELRFEELRNEIKDYYEDLYDVYHMSIMPNSNLFKIYSEYYVFDEDKSVKWNKEQVKLKNEEYEQEKERLIKLRDKEWQALSNKIARRLLETSQVWYPDEIKLSLEQLNLIVLYAMEYAPNNYEPTNILDSIILNLNLAVDLNI